jgi:hypothetical protein
MRGTDNRGPDATYIDGITHRYLNPLADLRATG